jgi:hypothetical protein
MPLSVKIAIGFVSLIFLGFLALIAEATIQDPIAALLVFTTIVVVIGFFVSLFIIFDYFDNKTHDHFR